MTRPRETFLYKGEEGTINYFAEKYNVKEGAMRARILRAGKKPRREPITNTRAHARLIQTWIKAMYGIEDKADYFVRIRAETNLKMMGNRIRSLRKVLEYLMEHKAEFLADVIPDKPSLAYFTDLSILEHMYNLWSLKSYDFGSTEKKKKRTEPWYTESRRLY